MSEQSGNAAAVASGKTSIVRPPAEASTVVVCETGQGLTQRLSDGRHQLVADEPMGSGGNDAGPDPYELLLMALGACTSVTLRLYARLKKWPLERISVQLRHTRNHLQDCSNCDEKTVKLDHIDRIIQLDGTLDSEQLARLLEIANRCPVHQSLTATFEIATTLGTIAL